MGARPESIGYSQDWLSFPRSVRKGMLEWTNSVMWKLAKYHLNEESIKIQILHRPVLKHSFHGTVTAKKTQMKNEPFLNVLAYRSKFKTPFQIP